MGMTNGRDKQWFRLNSKSVSFTLRQAAEIKWMGYGMKIMKQHNGKRPDDIDELVEQAMLADGIKGIKPMAQYATCDIPDHIKFFSDIEKIANGKQKAYYKWLINSVSLIHTSKLPKDIFIRSKTKNQCFTNAARVAMDNDHTTYIEGYIKVAGVYIEHAWNMIDGNYFDVTLGYDNTITYLRMMELDGDTVVDMIEENKSRFGPFLLLYFNKNICQK